MAIAHVTTVTGQTNATFAVDCTGGDLITVGFGARAVAGTDRDVTSMTYAGVAMSKAAEFDDAAQTDRLNVEIWYLKAPTTGSNNVVVTLTGTPQEKCIGAVVLSGVDQTSPLDAAGTGAAATSTSISSSVTVVNANSWILDSVIIDSGSGTITVDASQTQKWNIDTGSRVEGASTKAGVSAGAKTMDWTIGVTTPAWASIAASFKEASTTTSIKDPLGNGLIAFPR